jgi:hypothetical protein
MAKDSPTILNADGWYRDQANAYEIAGGAKERSIGDRKLTSTVNFNSNLLGPGLVE